MKKLLISFLMMFVIFSCGAASNNNQIILNLEEEGPSMDTSLMTDASSGTIASFLNEGLAKVNPNTKQAEPALAENWDISEDGLVWTFHLTAQDFKYAWLRGLDQKTASEYAYILFPIKNAEKFNSGQVSADEVGLEVVDPLTLKVTLENPTPYFATLLGFSTYYPENQKFIEEKYDGEVVPAF